MELNTFLISERVKKSSRQGSNGLVKYLREEKNAH